MSSRPCVGSTFTANGASVSSRTFLISARMFPAVPSASRVTTVWPALGPSTPMPPALPTAATSLASVSHTMAPWITGFSIP